MSRRFGEIRGSVLTVTWTPLAPLLVSAGDLLSWSNSRTSTAGWMARRCWALCSPCAS